MTKKHHSIRTGTNAPRSFPNAPVKAAKDVRVVLQCGRNKSCEILNSHGFSLGGIRRIRPDVLEQHRRQKRDGITVNASTRPALSDSYRDGMRRRLWRGSLWPRSPIQPLPWCVESVAACSCIRQFKRAMSTGSRKPPVSSNDPSGIATDVKSGAAYQPVYVERKVKTYAITEPEVRHIGTLTKVASLCLAIASGAFGYAWGLWWDVATTKDEAAKVIGNAMIANCYWVSGIAFAIACVFADLRWNEIRQLKSG